MSCYQERLKEFLDNQDNVKPINKEAEKLEKTDEILAIAVLVAVSRGLHICATSNRQQRNLLLTILQRR